MQLKNYALMILFLLLMLNGMILSVSAAVPEFAVTKTEASVSNAPDNSDMIVALYNNRKLTGMKNYHGSGTINAAYADDLSNALADSDFIKVFLWNMTTISPFGGFFGDEIKNLTDSVPPQKPERVLTVYFSCTGSTKTLAEKIHNIVGGDVMEIIPVEPYTSADLNYNNSGCRANTEINSDARPEIQASTVNAEQYDVILLGYPIWWGQCPPAVRTFLESYDFSEKTIMPFCTSGSSGIGGSLSKIRELCPDSTVTAGFRGTAAVAEGQIKAWLDTDNFEAAVAKRMKLTVGRNEIIIKLKDNNTANDLISRLPLDLKFEDYNNTEKISYLVTPLNTSDAPEGITPTAGDLTLYAPWGNLALFYKDFSYSSGLVSIGKVESGMEYVTSLSGTVKAELY